MVVIDASAMVDALLNDHIFQKLQSEISGQEMIAPDHLDIECLHAFRRIERSHAVSSADVLSFIDALWDLKCSRIPIQSLMKEVWALRDNFTAYDAGYVCLARATSSKLITHDRRLASSAGKYVETMQLHAAP